MFMLTNFYHMTMHTQMDNQSPRLMKALVRGIFLVNCLAMVLTNQLYSHRDSSNVPSSYISEHNCTLVKHPINNKTSTFYTFTGFIVQSHRKIQGLSMI